MLLVGKFGARPVLEICQPHIALIFSPEPSPFDDALGCSQGSVTEESGKMWAFIDQILVSPSPPSLLFGLRLLPLRRRLRDT